MSRPSLAFVRKELREISRDRRAVLLSFVLPIFVYPATFTLTSSLERREDARARGAVYRVAVTGDAESLRRELRADGAFAVIRLADDVDLESEVRHGRLEAWVDAPDGLAARGGELPEVRIVYHGPHEASAEAEGRLREALERHRAADADRRYREAGGAGSLSDLVAVETVDVATDAEAGGARAGRMIPLLLVMTLFIGASSLSTDLFAGEKERGTLETLYLAPVHRSRIARAKLLVVWGAGVVTGVLNLASLLACYRLGLISDPRDPAARVVLGGDGIATAFLLVLPLAALVGGILLGISAFARSLKEAQYYVTPVMLLALLPGLLATGQDVRLDAFTALIPLANVALAVRDGLVGPVPAHLLALVGAASVGWGALAMRWTTRILSREDAILGFDPEPLLAKTTAGRRRAALLGMAATVLAYFYGGTLLQSRALVGGLAASLWLLLPALGAGAARLAWSGGTVREVLSLRVPAARAALAGPLLGAALVVPMMRGVVALQSLVLPSPEGLFAPLTEPLEELGTPWVLLLLAASPGICEELVFRGVFLGLLRRVGSTRGAILASSAFFALIHLSVFRFLPTFLVGAALALLVVRTRSLVPAMLAHATYNGLAVASGRIPGLERLLESTAAWPASGAALVVAIALLAFPPRAGRRRAPPGS
jgi:sodium transport system permease protein